MNGDRRAGALRNTATEAATAIPDASLGNSAPRSAPPRSSAGASPRSRTGGRNRLETHAAKERPCGTDQLGRRLRGAGRDAARCDGALVDLGFTLHLPQRACAPGRRRGRAYGRSRLPDTSDPVVPMSRREEARPTPLPQKPGGPGAVRYRHGRMKSQVRRSSRGSGLLGLLGSVRSWPIQFSSSASVWTARTLQRPGGSEIPACTGSPPPGYSTFSSAPASAESMSTAGPSVIHIPHSSHWVTRSARTAAASRHLNNSRLWGWSPRTRW